MFDSKVLEQFNKNFNSDDYLKKIEDQQKLWYENFKKISKGPIGEKTAKMFEYIQEQNNILNKFQEKVKSGFNGKNSSPDIFIDAMKEMHFAFINSQIKMMNESIDEIKGFIKKK